jgi:hypothetical protein
MRLDEMRKRPQAGVNDPGEDSDNREKADEARHLASDSLAANAVTGYRFAESWQVAAVGSRRALV